MKHSKNDFFVGIFMIIAALSLMFLAIKVSGLSVSDFGSNTYKVTAVFTDIGGLKVRSPVRVAGVQVGQVSQINLVPNSYTAKVTLSLRNKINDLPVDTSARISQSGLLGDNFVSLSPGFSTQNLKNGSKIETTYSATNITSLISTFVSGGKKK